MNSIQLSVSVQTYNRGHNGYLRAALDAILAQTYADFELLVIDNHSSDETSEVVLSYKDRRLTYIRLPPGGTPADSFRYAYCTSRGRYLLTAHDDDIMEPTMIERQMSFMGKHADLGCLATNVSLINEHGISLQSALYQMENDRIFGAGDYIQAFFEEKLWLPTPTLLFNRSVGPLRNRQYICPTKSRYIPSKDIADLLKINACMPVAILAEPLLRYRQHAGQESRNVDQSGPLVDLAKYAKKLLSANQSNPKLHAMVPAIYAFSVRFQVQDLLFNQEDRALERRLIALKTHWEKSIAPEERGVDAALPFEILLGETGKELSIPIDTLDHLMQQPAKNGSQIAYRQWTRLVHNGKSIFSGVDKLQRIAILGSMLTAYLLVLAARKCGIEVACCVDSSPARIGKNVLGIPIMSHEYLHNHGEHLDAVILSNERDHEEAIRKMLQHAQEVWRFQIYSWKEMVGGKQHDS